MKPNTMKKIFTIIASTSCESNQRTRMCHTSRGRFWSRRRSRAESIFLSILDYLGQKNYQEAAMFWWQAKVAAPKYKPNLYSNGVSIYQKLAGAAKKAKDTATNHRNMADSLFMVYDLWTRHLW